MISNVHFENFRCFRDLEIDGIKDVGRDKEFSYIRLDKKPTGQISAKVYTDDLLEFALSEDMEVR